MKDKMLIVMFLVYVIIGYFLTKRIDESIKKKKQK